MFKKQTNPNYVLFFSLWRSLVDWKVGHHSNISCQFKKRDSVYHHYFNYAVVIVSLCVWRNLKLVIYVMYKTPKALVTKREETSERTRGGIPLPGTGRRTEHNIMTSLQSMHMKT